jgi:hypothetical protein
MVSNTQNCLEYYLQDQAINEECHTNKFPKQLQGGFLLKLDLVRIIGHGLEKKHVGGNRFARFC